ncbi:MAG: RagB/SusD family nutrient uptake outer membrane protein, partial [Peptostreptococcaceae bacterium]|nr:RagB/SusD family nutrient uptake outer membrane protein [Peptostreptococcaceae bacterium]
PIGIAASEDGGATWKYIGNCNIDYHPDKNPTYWAPEVIEYEGIYHMFVTFKKGSPGLWGGSPTILYTTDRSNCAINTILMRYADILLMHAEALVEGSSTSQEIY